MHRLLSPLGIAALLGVGAGDAGPAPPEPPAPYVPPAPTYSHPLGTGDRLLDMDVTFALAPSFGEARNLVNESTATTSAGSVRFNTGDTAANVITFDFGPRSRVFIEEFTWLQGAATTHGTWVFEYLTTTPDTWASVGTISSLGGILGNNVYSFGVAHGGISRFWRLRQTAGNVTTGTNIQEITFKLSDHEEFATYITNLGGKGDRQASMTVTYSGTLGGGTPDNVIDNAFTNDNTAAIFFAASDSAKYLLFDFGSPVLIDKLYIMNINTNAMGTGRFQSCASDGTPVETLKFGAGGSDDIFNLGGALRRRIIFDRTASGNPIPASRYWRLYVIGTTGSNPRLIEIQFATVVL